MANQESEEMLTVSSAVRTESIWHCHPLLMAVQNDTVTLEVFYKVKLKFTPFDIAVPL